jgi:hypothetical protein
MVNAASNYAVTLKRHGYPQLYSHFLWKSEVKEIQGEFGSSEK